MARSSNSFWNFGGGDVFVWRMWRRGRSSRRRSRAITQVPGGGVIEDAPVKIVHGVRARWPDSTSYIARVYTSFQGILIYTIIIADSLFGSNQVCHVDAAVGEPASDHEYEQRPKVW